MRFQLISALVIALTMLFGTVSQAKDPNENQDVLPLGKIPLVLLSSPDFEALAEEDAWREEDGLPDRFAVARHVSLDPENSGTWEDLPQGRQLWRLRVSCPEALSLNLGFTFFQLPSEATLSVYAADGSGRTLQYSAADHRSSGQLWTPVLITDDLIIELEMAGSDRGKELLELGQVGCGYRYFGQDDSQKSGLCNIDVVCPEGDDWREDIPSVGRYTYNTNSGSFRCTGVMVNNTAQDERPLFLTANHCEVSADFAASVVVYWNYESPNCGDHGGGSLEQTTLGATLLANYSVSDVRLLELEASPDTAYGVTFAGWDRSGDVPTSAIAIHHPSADEKSISFEDDALSITTYLVDVGPGNETHLRVEDWDLGTTEPGSSGSPLFDADHHIVGQLHGGYAACGNDRPDWYGRLSVSWEGGGTPESRLSDYLDPHGTGAVILNRFGDDDPDPEPLPPGEMDLYFASVSPNPFLDETEITLHMNQAGSVHVRVLNILGQLVCDLGTIEGARGNNTITWNGNDQDGRPAPAGLYLFYLESAGQTARGQVVRLR